jgi:hypothetical protein
MPKPEEGRRLMLRRCRFPEDTAGDRLVAAGSVPHITCWGEWPTTFPVPSLSNVAGFVGKR